MSDPNKSFFSGLHLAITGTAAFITSVVAVLGLALNQGWLGGGHSKSTSATATATTTTTPGSGTTPGDTTTTLFGSTSPPGGGTFNVAPAFTVDPPKLVFQTFGPTDATVTVKNTGTSTVTVQSPTIIGPDTGRFTATDLGCAGSLDPLHTCQIKVTFLHAAGTFSATLVVTVTGAPPLDVPIQASAVL